MQKQNSHSPTPSHDCDNNIESNMAPAHCRVCKKDMSTPSLSEGEGWRNTLRKFWGTDTDGEYWNDPDCSGEQIEDFISQTLSNERQRMVALGESLLDTDPNNYQRPETEAWNSAIITYQQKIKSLDS